MSGKWWTDEMFATLERLWKENLSASQIGKVMGISRSAVLGKTHRLGWQRVVTKATPSKRERKPRSPAVKKPKKIYQPIPKVFEVPFLQRRRNQCAALDDKRMCCGLPVDRGSYCYEHANQFYVRLWGTR